MTNIMHRNVIYYLEYEYSKYPTAICHTCHRDSHNKICITPRKIAHPVYPSIIIKKYRFTNTHTTMSNDSQKRGLWQSPIMLFIAVGMSISTSPHLFGATVVFIILASLAFSIASVLIAVSLTGSNIAKSHMWHTLQRNCQSESIVHKSIAFYILGTSQSVGFE